MYIIHTKKWSYLTFTLCLLIVEVNGVFLLPFVSVDKTPIILFNNIFVKKYKGGGKRRVFAMLAVVEGCMLCRKDFVKTWSGGFFFRHSYLIATPFLPCVSL